MEKRNVKIVSGLMYAGFVFLGIGIFGNFIFFLPEVVNYVRYGKPDPFVGFMIVGSNVSLFAGAVFLMSSFITAIAIKSAEKSAPAQLLENCRIMSRFALNEVGEMIFSDWEHSAPGGKLYIQIEISSGKSKELRTSWPVFLECGEGMVGSAYVEGDWISSFIPRKIETVLPQGPPAQLNDWHP